jgi:hypothetical protein
MAADPEAAAVANANYKALSVTALKDTRQTLAGALTDARANVERLAHFKRKGDRVMYSPAKEAAAVKRLGDALADCEAFAKAHPDLPA